MDTRRLLLGDWTPVLRDGIDLLRLALGAGAVVLLLAGATGAAAVLATTFVFTLVARVVNLPRVYDLAFVVAMSLQGWGEAAGAYDALPWFDRLTHVLIPMLAAPVAVIALARLDVVPDPKDETTTRHYVGLFVIALAVGIAVGALWELVEWFSDSALGTRLQESVDDTSGDLLADTVGALAGAALLVGWARFGWGSVRRIPGENRREDTEAPSRV